MQGRDPRLPLAAAGCFWLLLAAPGCSWMLLAAPGCPWLPRICHPTGAPLKARREIFQNLPSRARKTICLEARCVWLLWAALDCPALLWAALGCPGLLGLLWAAVSKYIVVPLRQNACKFWRLENAHPNLPANWCSRAGETPYFPKAVFWCTRNDMFSNSAWLLALPGAALGCSATGAPVQARRPIFQNRPSRARETICFQTRCCSARGCLGCFGPRARGCLDCSRPRCRN